MRYEAPETIEAAIGVLSGSDGKARILAGGTDLIVQMRSGMIEPDLVLDIKRIPSMHEIAEENGGYRIGAAVSCAELGEHTGVKSLWPGVVEAAELIGSTQVQGRCTVVGNLCNASPAADSVPAMIVANALARVIGPNGERDVPVGDIPTGPGKTSLQKGELVASVYLPPKVERTGDAYLRFIPRTEMDIAVVGAGVCLTLDSGGVCTAARVALGAVAATALLVEDAAGVLVGNKLDDEVLNRLGEAASNAATPIDDKRGTVEFRKDVSAVLAKRAAKIAHERAQGA